MKVGGAKEYNQEAIDPPPPLSGVVSVLVLES